MQVAKYGMYVPLEMGDVIQGKKSNNKYLITDIQHTYSIKQKNVISVNLCVTDIDTKEEKIIKYDEDKWKIIKYNYEK